jgi:hypothetical protein
MKRAPVTPCNVAVRLAPHMEKATEPDEQPPSFESGPQGVSGQKILKFRENLDLSLIK